MSKKSIKFLCLSFAAVVFAVMFAFTMPQTAKATSGTYYTVKVSKGYLALRSAAATNVNNEIGQLKNGDRILITDKSKDSKGFWYGYTDNGGKGYVNKNYLTVYKNDSGSSSSTTATAYNVSVASGTFLAVRSSAATSDSNIIGKLYNGGTFYVTTQYSGTFWYGYAVISGEKVYGYVNKNYLASSKDSSSSGSSSSSDSTSTTGTAYKASVASGTFLAVRSSAKTIDSNIIGKLNNGDTFYVTKQLDGTFWYGYATINSKKVTGYVNKNYLKIVSGGSTVNSNVYVVKVAAGYLAVRSKATLSSDNEIGKLYTGDTFTVTTYGNGTYWYGYATINKKNVYGYVNKNYLVSPNSANVITAHDITKTASTKKLSFNLGATAGDDAKLTYSSNNKYIKVSSAGKITVTKKYIGKATITIKAAATSTLKAATKTITVTVIPPESTIKSVLNVSGGKLNVTYTTSTLVKGYQIWYSTNANFTNAKKKVVTKKAVNNGTIKGLTVGNTYYVRVRTYKKTSGKYYYSDWSNVKPITIVR